VKHEKVKEPTPLLVH